MNNGAGFWLGGGSDGEGMMTVRLVTGTGCDRMDVMGLKGKIVLACLGWMGGSVFFFWGAASWQRVKIQNGVWPRDEEQAEDEEEAGPGPDRTVKLAAWVQIGG